MGFTRDIGGTHTQRKIKMGTIMSHFLGQYIHPDQNMIKLLNCSKQIQPFRLKHAPCNSILSPFGTR